MFNGGGAASMPFPYSLDFSTLPDGPIPNWFKGGNFLVSSGKAVNTPTLTESLLNNAFANWSGDNPSNWSITPAEDGSNYVTEASGAGVGVGTARECGLVWKPDRLRPADV